MESQADTLLHTVQDCRLWQNHHFPKDDFFVRAQDEDLSRYFQRDFQEGRSIPVHSAIARGRSQGPDGCPRVHQSRSAQGL